MNLYYFKNRQEDISFMVMSESLPDGIELTEHVENSVIEFCWVQP